MRLTRLELRNICQHEQLKFEFGAGLIGVYGPNGSGKSNAMNVAAYAALTNDYGRHLQGKSGMIRQQAGEEEQSAIQLTFEQDGSTYSILRGLRKPSTHKMFRPGQPTLSKSREIEEELENVLGIKRRLIDDYIFVAQWQLFQFLSATPAERAKSFAHLCNTTHAERCWELLGEQIIADTPLASQVVDNTDEIRGQIGDYNKRLKPLRAEIKQLRKTLVTRERERELAQVVSDWHSKQTLAAELPELETDLQEKLEIEEQARQAGSEARAEHFRLRELAREATAREDRDAERYEEAEREAKSARNRLVELKTLARDLKRKKELREKISEAEAGVAALEKAAPEPVDEELRAALRENARRLEREIDRAEELLDNCDDEGVTECPTCGTPTSQLADRIADARENFPRFCEELRVTRDELEDLSQRDKTLRDHAEKLRGEQRQIATWRDELRRYEELKPVAKGTSAKLREVVAQADARRKTWDAARKQARDRRQDLDDYGATVRKAERKVSQAEADAAAARETLRKARAKWDALDVSEEAFQRAEERLGRHKRAQAEIAAHKARVEELEGFVQQKREELERVERRLARSRRARDWVQVLSRARDEVFHRDCLPRVVHQSYLADMVDEVNGYLEDFDSPFHVTATQDVGFTAHFDSGTVMPAPGLSGGQKVMLALAFRLTVNSIFAPQLGTMILDEPTDGLDTENREIAAEMFRQLGITARDRGLQIIVITHDDAMEAILDQKIVLERAV